MKETYFFSSEMYFFSPLRWGIVSLACPGHVISQCSLADGSWGSIVLCCHLTETCTLQVLWAFDLAAAHESCRRAWILMDPIVSNGNFVLDSYSEFSCYRKGIFILLFSESHRLLCNKNQINATISWG